MCWYIRETLLWVFGAKVDIFFNLTTDFVANADNGSVTMNDGELILHDIKLWSVIRHYVCGQKQYRICCFHSGDYHRLGIGSPNIVNLSLINEIRPVWIEKSLLLGVQKIVKRISYLIFRPTTTCQI